LVDDTPPSRGSISLLHQKPVPYTYHPHLKPLEIKWAPFKDTESDIEGYIVRVISNEGIEVAR